MRRCDAMRRPGKKYFYISFRGELCSRASHWVAMSHISKILLIKKRNHRIPFFKTDTQYKLNGIDIIFNNYQQIFYNKFNPLDIENKIGFI